MTAVKSFRLDKDTLDKLDKLVTFYKFGAPRDVLPVGRISQANVVSLTIRRLYADLKKEGYDVP